MRAGHDAGVSAAVSARTKPNDAVVGVEVYGSFVLKPAVVRNTVMPRQQRLHQKILNNPRRNPGVSAVSGLTETLGLSIGPCSE